MKECKLFKELYETIENIGSKDLKMVGNNPFATGHVDGCLFRLFQEADTFYEDGTVRDYTACVVIKDETETGSMWPAFYSRDEIINWFENRKKSQ